MAEDLRALVVQIKGDTSALRRELAAAKSSVAQFAGQTDAATSRMGAAFAKLNTLVGSLFAIGTVLAIQRFVDQTYDYAEALAIASERVGISVEALQRFRFVADQAGIGVELFDKALEKLGTRAGIAIVQGGESARVFRALGVSLKDAEGNALPLEEVFLDVADKLSVVTDKFQRGAIEAKIFGDELGPRLDPMLAQGRAAIEILGERAGVLTKEMTDHARQSNQDFRLIADGIMTFARDTVFGLSMMTADALRFMGILDRPIGEQLSRQREELFSLAERYEDLLAQNDARDGGLAHEIAVTRERIAAQQALVAALERQNATVEERKRLESELRKSLQSGGVDLTGTLGTKPPPLDLAGPATPEPKANPFREESLARQAKLMEVLGAQTRDVALAAEDARAIGADMASALTDGLRDAIFNANDLNDALRGVLQRLLDIAAAAAFKPIEDSLSSFFGNALSSLFGGGIGGGKSTLKGKAVGGPVRAGTPYLVGERGPELFVPDLSGAIVPNHAMGGTSVVIYQSFDFSGANPATVAMLESVAARIKTDTLRAVPAVVVNARRTGRLSPGY